MKCKQCGTYNEDYLEYCTNCAAPLTPDDSPEQPKEPAPSAEGNAANAGGTPPAWGFVKAPQWPKPDFSADTVSEEDIPEQYYNRFTPHPADGAAQKPAYSESDAVPFNDDVRSHPVSNAQQNTAGQYNAPRQQYSAPQQQQYGAPQQQQHSAPRHKSAGNAVNTAEDVRQYKKNAGKTAAPAEDAKPRKAEKRDDFDRDYSGLGEHKDNKRNLLFIAAAGILVVLILVFGLIFINTKYGGDFNQFINSAFKGDPVTKAPTVEKGLTDDGDTAYIITIYAKNNTTVRFTAGELVRELAVTQGSISLRVPEQIWIPDEPLDTAELSITPDIVVITSSGEETQLTFDEPIIITVPSVELTMTQPTVSEFTVDSTTVPIAGVVSDNTASIYVGETQVAVDEAGNFSTNFTLPGEGTYTLLVEAKKNGCKTATETYSITYGTASDPTAVTSEGNVALAIDDSVTRSGTASTMTVTGTMEVGATISVTGVELSGEVTADSAAGTFSFTVNTPDVGLYEAVITATSAEAAKSSTVYLEHQPEKDAYMGSVYRIDYARIRDYPNHEQGYKITGTIAEIYQTTPYVKARIETSEGDIVFCYYSGVATIEMNDGKSYELYADPFGTDETTGLPQMHAWFVIKRSN